ncbi:MAG: GGDEF domain-containing protein [Lachnospiraceae bacterium]|nr:GGDEF domain-containing protein [Lachnospiraceae bacterium]
MNKKKKTSNSRIEIYIPAIIMIIVLFVLANNYKDLMLDKARSVVLSKYMLICQDSSKKYTEVFASMNSTSKMIVEYLSENGFSDEKACADILQSAVTYLDIDNAFIVDSEGKVIDKDGKRSPNIAAAAPFVEITDNKVNTIRSVNSDGNLWHYIVRPVGDLSDGSVILLFSGDKVTKINDVVNGARNSKIVTYLLMTNEGIIMDSAGLNTADYEPGSLIFDDIDIDNLEFVNMTRKSFINSIKVITTGTVEVKKQNISKYMIYAPVSGSNCLVMVMLSQGNLESMVRDENKNTDAFIKKLMIVMIIFIAALFLIILKNLLTVRLKNKGLETKAETDLLTNLYNKVSAENRIKEYLSEEGADHKSMMILIDIDNFKKINDTMGHAFGDEVLKAVGQALKAQFRASDIVGRLGGDEFVVLLKNMPDEETMVREAKKLDRMFKDFQVGTYTKYSPTASMGVAIVPNDAKDFESLYKKADEALYRSKNNGKNQMTFYSERMMKA